MVITSRICNSKRRNKIVLRSKRRRKGAKRDSGGPTRREPQKDLPARGIEPLALSLQDLRSAI